MRSTEGTPAFPNALKGMLGMWSLTLDDDSVAPCIVKLRTATTIGGYRLDIAKDCPKDYPTDGVGAWNIGTGDEIVFIDVHWIIILVNIRVVRSFQAHARRPRNFGTKSLRRTPLFSRLR